MNNELERMLIQQATAMEVPIKATLELTPLCNLNCEMCYIRHSVSEMKAAGGAADPLFWEEIIPQLKKLGVLFVCLIGGEPFLHPRIRELYEKLCDNGFLVNITSNATLLAEGVPDWLIQKPPRYVTVSLYGASDETYARVTGNPRGYSMAMQGLENLLAAGIGVKLNYMVTPHNFQDLDAIYAIKEKYQLPLLASAYSFPAARKFDNTSACRLSPEVCAEYDMRIRQLNAGDGYIEQCRSLIRSTECEASTIQNGHVSCAAGRSMFWINWQGKFMACGLMNQIQVPVMNMDLEHAWSRLREETRAVVLSQECTSCRYRKVCQTCAAAIVAETGSFLDRPSYLCHMTDEIINIARRNINEDS